MSEHNLDETTQQVTRGMRVAMMMGAQMAEQAARRRAEAERRAADESRERAAQVREAMAEARDTARAAYEPVADPRRFAQADRETVAGAWTTAKAWSNVDPRAAAAEASLAEQIRQRWGVDATEFTGADERQRQPEQETTSQQPDGPTPQDPPETQLTDQQERLVEAMSPQWRQEATVDDLEARWHEANNAIDQPGALDARAAVEGELGERFGLDVDRFNRTVEHGLGEEAWAALGDRAAADADRAAEGSERLEEAGWENQADAEHGREAGADGPGEETEESVDALEAEGKGTESAADAETEHGHAQQEDGAALTQQNVAESRANAADMAAAGVPSRSQAVRTKTARAFGAVPAAIARFKQHRQARKNVARKGRGAEKELGR